MVPPQCSELLHFLTRWYSRSATWMQMMRRTRHWSWMYIMQHQLFPVLTNSVKVAASSAQLNTMAGEWINHSAANCDGKSERFIFLDANYFCVLHDAKALPAAVKCSKDAPVQQLKTSAGACCRWQAPEQRLRQSKVASLSAHCHSGKESCLGAVNKIKTDLAQQCISVFVFAITVGKLYNDSKCVYRSRRSHTKTNKLYRKYK